MAIEITVKIDNAEENMLGKLESNDDRVYVSDYARFFNESCPGWTNDAEKNVIFLKAQEHFANVLLVQRGHLFLNEVYDLLGIPRSKAGQVVGWIFDTKNPVGDNYVSFDLYDQRNEGFINGLENSALLDFNVDGVILDKIP